MDVEVALPGRYRVGEGPVWHDDGLSFVDIVAGEVVRWAPGETGAHTTSVDTMVGAIAPRSNGEGYVAATTEGFAVIADGKLDTRVAFLPDGQRMNDAKVDPYGRFWAGSCTMDFAPGTGAFHVLNADWTVDSVLDGLTLPNGLGWSPDGGTLYLADTEQHTLTAYGCRPDSSDLTDARSLVEWDGDMPDGLCVDAAGDLWIAMWGGRRLEHRGPDGVLIDEVPMPVAQPSCCAFGGADLDVLYVTSACEGLGQTPDPDGSLLRVIGLGATGRMFVPFGG